MVLDHEFPPDPRVENEIGSLTKAGHDIYLACYTLNNKPRHEKLGNLTIYRKPISKFFYKTSVGALKFPFYFNFWRKFLNELANDQKFDAIHVHDLPLAKVGHEFSQKHKIPFILDLHENWPSLLETSEYANTFLGKLLSNDKQWKRYEKKYALKADCIVTVVEEMKERICKLGASPEKVLVLSNTFNLDNAFELNNSINNDRTVLYYAGGINRHRGLQTVIKGLEHIIPHRKDIVVWIVGSGKYLSALQQIVAGHNLTDHVKFYGQRSFNETMELLSKSDIALIPHLKSVQTDNSSPNKLYQYMYFQKPVVISNCKSLERIVSETSCGAVYQFDDPSSFAKAVLNMIDSGLMETYGKNGRSAVLKKYNWGNSVKPLLEMYNSLDNA